MALAVAALPLAYLFALGSAIAFTAFRPLGFLLILTCLGIPLWAITDAASRPTSAFASSGWSKRTWLTLMTVFTFLAGVVGVVLAVVYLASVRPRVRRAMSQDGHEAVPVG